MPGRKTLVLGLLALLVLYLTACKSEPAQIATPTPVLAPLEIAARAANAMLSTESMHFTIERDGALAFIDTQQLLAFKRAEGDFDLPDRMRAIVRVVTAFTPIDIGMVALGDEQYATDPVTGRWGWLPLEWGQINLVVLFDPETGLQRLLKDGIYDLKLVGNEEIEKQRHYHLAGRVSGERMSAMTLGFIGHGDVELEVWVGIQDYHVRRIWIVEPETDPKDPTTWHMEFSNLGEPVKIDAPSIADDSAGAKHINNGTDQAVSARWW